MAFVIADRVRETTTTTGTGNLTLDGAVSKFRTFASVLSSSDTTYYSIVEQTGTAWEVGIGTFTSPATLARTTILSSSSGGSAVNFGAGTKDVFITLPASKTNVEDQPNLIEVNSASDALRITQTGTGNALVVEDSANPDSSPFVVDASGNVGIGTNATGAARLVVTSPANSTSLLLTDATQSTLSIVHQPSNLLTYEVAGSAVQRWVGNSSERMRIDASGNVGIGTTSPNQKLDVKSTIRASGPSAGSMDMGHDGANGNITNNTGGMLFYANGSAAGNIMVWHTNSAERMRIENGGNVGIGTSSPQAKLVASNSGAAGMEFFTNYPGGGVGTYIQSYNRSTSAYVNTAYDALAHSFRTSGSERMVIDSSGNLKFNSGYGSVATAYGCRAWVNFNGTGTVAIRASGNVTSITDSGVGDYVVNFATAMPDANYSAVASLSHYAAVTRLTIVNVDAPSTSSIALLAVYGDPWAHYDPTEVYLAIFR